MKTKNPAFLAAAALVGLAIDAAPISAKADTAPVTIEDVGDVYSFGRSVTYLGFAQTTNIRLRQDCSSQPPAQRCVTLAPAPEATTFDESELARVQLPAKATRSLLCFVMNSFGGYEFLNTTGEPQPVAEFDASGIWTVESPVLNDPTLIDPTTGLPFGGRLVLSLPAVREVRSLAVDEMAFKQLSMTRGCSFGLNKRGLMETWGLSETLANQFFQKPITLRFGAQGTAQLVSFANYLYAIRLYGD